MIRIYGTMTDPSGQPVPGAIIELRAINSTREVLLGSTVNHKCDQQGAYSFQLAIGTYDAYAQNDRCGDMDYLGTARVSDNSVDGDLHSILVDGGINITPPMLDSALAAAQRAESAAALTAADRVSTGQNAESAKTDSAAAKTAKDEAVSAAGTAVSARDSIVTDANDVRRLATQIADQAADVSSKHSDVATKAGQVSAQADAVSTKYAEVVTKAAQVSDDAAATQSAKNISAAAADTATQKAASAATHDASAQAAATRAENAASAVVGAIIDGGECDLSGGVYPQPVSASGITYSTVWFVAVGGTVGVVSYDAGDQLRYTTANSGYYFKVDAKDDVYSVNGEKGAVTVTPEKIGAEVSGAASQLVSQHESKPNAHAISGVSGLQVELDSKFSPSNKPSANDVSAEPAGAVAAAISAHEAKLGAHQISGVAGLRAELDALAGASGGISAINDRLVVVEGKVATLEQRKSTCLVNATGTGAPHETVVAQLPANIVKNTRYVLPNPFGINTPVECWAEVFANGRWACTGWAYANGGYGTNASYVQGEGIVVQTGGLDVAANSANTGGGHGLVAGATSAPCRVFVRKLEA